MTTVNHGMYYAMKRVSKKHIVAKRQEEHMLFEKKILKAIQCDFIVRYPWSQMCQLFTSLSSHTCAHTHTLIFSPLGFTPHLKTCDTSTWSWSSAEEERSGPNSKKCEREKKNYHLLFTFIYLDLANEM